jgi:hypothetical protein
MECAHQPDQVAHLDRVWSRRDGESPECYAQAFAGEVPSQYVPLLLVLQNAAATAALVACSDCCSNCQFAAFKHRLVAAHHIARSLAKLHDTVPVGTVAGARVGALLGDPAVREVLALRALRNGLVHLGLSDVPAEAFTTEDPVHAVIEHYTSGRRYEDVYILVWGSLRHLHEELTQWLLEAPKGEVGFARLLQPPAD